MPLATQERVDDGRLVDAVEHDRPLLGGDATGEAPAEGDGDPLAHLLLDAPGGGGDQAVAVGVQEEDGGRVDVQQPADAFEQLVEKLLDPQVDQIDVAEVIDPREPRRCGLGFHH